MSNKQDSSQMSEFIKDHKVMERWNGVECEPVGGECTRANKLDENI